MFIALAFIASDGRWVVEATTSGNSKNFTDVDELLLSMEDNVYKGELRNVSIANTTFLPPASDMGRIFDFLIRKKIKFTLTVKRGELGGGYLEQIVRLIAANVVHTFLLTCDRLSVPAHHALADAVQGSRELTFLKLGGSEHASIFIETVRRPMTYMAFARCTGAIHALASRRSVVDTIRIVVDDITQAELDDLCVALTTRGNTIDRLALYVEPRIPNPVPPNPDLLIGPLREAFTDPECKARHVDVEVGGVHIQIGTPALLAAREQRERNRDRGQAGLLTVMQPKEMPRYGTKSALRELPFPIVHHLLAPMLFVPRQPFRE